MQDCKLSPNDCWKALEKMRKAIPFGKVCTYSKIGSKVDWDEQAVVEAYYAPDVNNPFAKAIGDVCSVNPFAVVVPCFRIINADHTLGGFMGNPHVDRETGIKNQGMASRNTKVAESPNPLPKNRKYPDRRKGFSSCRRSITHPRRKAKISLPLRPPPRESVRGILG